MNVVSVNASETPVRTGTEGLVAVGRRAWSAVARLALVAGLAVALLVGALALGPHSEASAAPMSCRDALKVAEVLIDTAGESFTSGNYALGYVYLEMADEFIGFC